MKHLRNMAQLFGTPFGEWIIFTFLEGMIQNSNERGGILEKVKQKFVPARRVHHRTMMYKEYYAHLKPVGGSYAGATRQIPERAGVVTRGEASGWGTAYIYCITERERERETGDVFYSLF